jgi:16S rRNA m(7)G-527 methyltransferase (EC 2.1.1.-)
LRWKDRMPMKNLTEQRMLWNYSAVRLKRFTSLIFRVTRASVQSL